MKPHELLDVTDLKERGSELSTAIHNAVKDTQGPLIGLLPNMLLLTPAQFDSLQHDPDMVGAYNSTDLIFQTPLNVMEVRVKQDV